MKVLLPLLEIKLSADETTLELDFASRIVTVKGKRLHEVFCSIAAGRSEALFALNATHEIALGTGYMAPFISDIRVKNAPAEI